MYLLGRILLLLAFLTSCSSAKTLQRQDYPQANWEHASCDVIVEPEEHWQDIAKRTQVPISILKRFSKINKLNIGSRILVPARKIYIVNDGDTILAIAVKYGMTFSELVNINDLQPPFKLKIGQEIKIIELKKPKKVITKRAAKKITKFSLIWPTNGKVVTKFGSSKNGSNSDGIRILVNSNSSIKAAASGNVVYVGNEVGNYGNLVIIQSKQEWFTSYGNLSEILVKKGDEIKSGQIIGQIDHQQLYFAVRKDSVPVNPIKYLKGKING